MPGHRTGVRAAACPKATCTQNSPSGTPDASLRTAEEPTRSADLAWLALDCQSRSAVGGGQDAAGSGHWGGAVSFKVPKEETYSFSFAVVASNAAGQAETCVIKGKVS